jgi:hypothetical protein
MRFNGRVLQVCAGLNWQTINMSASAPTVLNHTGANQTYTVPAGVSAITVKMWGAGGGGGSIGSWTFGFEGGAGGYSQGVIAVTPGQQLTVVVGGGGLAGSGTNGAKINETAGSSAFGGGGIACKNPSTDCRYGGGGGGRSEIRTSGGTILMVAGGGGGGGSAVDATYGVASQAGGAGGGLFGQNGLAQGYEYAKGLGGTQVAGGAGGHRHHDSHSHSRSPWCHQAQWQHYDRKRRQPNCSDGLLYLLVHC